MATLKQYVGKNNYYVHGGYRTNGHALNSTYQITPRGLGILLGKKIANGGKIPESLFLRLKKSGDLYTGGSGPGNAKDDIPPLLPRPDKQMRLHCELCERRYGSVHALRDHCAAKHQGAQFSVKYPQARLHPSKQSYSGVTALLTSNAAQCKLCNTMLSNDADRLMAHFRERHQDALSALVRSQFSECDLSMTFEQIRNAG